MARRQSGDAIRFVTTQFTLLVNLARGSADEINPHWGRFFDLYYPTMVKYAEMFCAPQDAEDIAQGVLVRLVDVMRSGGYERRPGVRFSTYVKTLVRNEFIDWRRREAARGLGRTVLQKYGQYNMFYTHDGNTHMHKCTSFQRLCQAFPYFLPKIAFPLQVFCISTAKNASALSSYAVWLRTCCDNQNGQNRLKTAISKRKYSFRWADKTQFSCYAKLCV